MFVKYKILLPLFGGLLLFLSTPAVFAADIPAPLGTTVTRSSANPLEVVINFGFTSGFKIQVDTTQTGGVIHYKYSFFDTTLMNPLSVNTLFLQGRSAFSVITDALIPSTLSGTGWTSPQAALDTTATSLFNPLPEISLTDSNFGAATVVEFDSNKLPVWGKFRATFSNDAAQSVGMLSAMPVSSTGPFDAFVPVPGPVVVPEPTTLVILGSSLAALVAKRGRKGRK